MHTVSIFRNEDRAVVCLSQDEGFFQTLVGFVGEGKVALLQAYFDESVRENRLLCVAGYIFAPQQAGKLAKQFMKEFGPYGGLHMKELCHKRRGYKSVTDAERTRLIREAVRIVRNRFSYGIAVTMNIDEYESQAPRFIRGMKGAYPFLCHMAMYAVGDILRKFEDPSLVHYVFEAGHSEEAEARFAVNQISTHPEMKQWCRHSGDSFLKKADAIPLQAADLLAWEIAKFKDETVDKPVREMRLSLRSLFTADPQRYAVYTLQGEPLTTNMGKYWKLALEQIEEDNLSRAGGQKP